MDVPGWKGSDDGQAVFPRARPLYGRGRSSCPRQRSRRQQGQSPHPGTFITTYDTKEFDEYALRTGPCPPVATPACKTKRLEGKVTMIHYSYPKGRSTLEVLKNYQEALVTAGFQEVFHCAGRAGCGSGPKEADLGYFGHWDNRYFAAKLARPAGDAYVAVNVVQDEDIHLVVVEAKPMQSELVTVSAASLARDLAQSGHSAVYQIYFDTAKADLKPESDATLGEIAKLLQQDPKLKLYVVGHTDNVLTLDANMDLSRRRAASVTKALSERYGVAPARLDAHGVGPLAPVASNDGEDGRAKNRRVELVKE